MQTSEGHEQTSLVEADRLKIRRTKLKARAEKILARLKVFQNARLLAGAAFFIVCVLLTIRPQWHLELPVLVFFIALFTWLVIATRRLDAFHQKLNRYYLFSRRQENRLRGGRPADDGSLADAARGNWLQAQERSQEQAQKGVKRSLPYDLGLFGPQSLWTLIDETLTDGGLEKLLDWLTGAPLPVAAIENRQRTIERLRGERWFYSRLCLVASGRNDVRLASAQIREFLREPFVDEGFNFVVILNLLAWFLLGSLTVASMLQGWGIGGYAVLVFAVISLGSVNKTASSFTKGVGLAHHLSELSPIFADIEKRLRLNTGLKEFFPQTAMDGPSRQVRGLNRILGFLGTQTNPLLHLVLNAVLPWTLTAAFVLERRRKSIAKSFPISMDELAEFEALGSLLIFKHYQTQTFPHFAAENAGATPLKFEGLYHPLLDRASVVANDFEFPTLPSNPSGARSLGLLTGSNMSGKSTFLRTVGVNQMLANMGAPVFARSMRTIPLAIETCIEVSDSLRDGVSYFYAEVRKLKSILNAAAGPSPVLFLIDEIFRGTNNRERQVGSRAVIRTLADSRSSIGFVSTHDLELISLEQTSPRCLNLHFREDIDPRGRMVFSYKLRPGPCPTTNALKIMQAEGIDLGSDAPT